MVRTAGLTMRHAPGQRRIRAIERLGRRRRRGLILVLALWMIVVLSLVAYSLAYEMQMEMTLTGHRRDGLRALELARLGVARAVADLKNDVIMDYATDLKRLGEIVPFDGLGDPYRDEEEYTDVEVDDEGYYTVRVVDQESKILLNSTNPRHLKTMENLLRILGVNDREAQEMAQAIFDWMDVDDTPVGGEGESELLFYNEMHARLQGGRWDEETAVVRPRNDYFMTLDQLLEIPGMTKDLLYGYDPDDPEAVQERQERLERGREVTPGLRDLLTIHSAGHINVNTASREVLAAVFATVQGDNISDGEKTAEDLRKAVGADARSPDNDDAARTIQDLAQALGPQGQALVAQANMVHPLNVRSFFFEISAEGYLLGPDRERRITRRIETVVHRAYESFTVNEEREDIRERRFSRERALERSRRDRRDGDTIGAIQIPNVRCLWWSEK